MLLIAVDSPSVDKHEGAFRNFVVFVLDIFQEGVGSDDWSYAGVSVCFEEECFEVRKPGEREFVDYEQRWNLNELTCHSK